MHTRRTPLAVHVTPFHGHISRPEGRRGPSHTDEEPRPEERGGVHTGRGALALGAWSGFSLEASASWAWAGVRAFWHLRTRARRAFDQLRRAAGGGACALRGVGFALRVGYVPRASERLVAR